MADTPDGLAPANPSHGSRVGPDVGSGDPTDGRNRYDWESHYPDNARTQIRREAWYAVFLLFTSLALMFLTWKGTLGWLLAVNGDAAVSLKKHATYASSGLLGGAVFGIKYLYRVVARGYWHVDRKLWRYLSPLNAAVLGLVMGAAIEAGLFSVHRSTSMGGAVVFGFLVGYFADQAISKLHEIATAMFGTSLRSEGGPSKSTHP